MKYMKNLLWRVFQCMKIVEVQSEIMFSCLLFVYNLLISNTYMCHQQMCVM